MIRYLIAIIVSGVVYAGLFFLADTAFGSSELLYQWQYGGKRELLMQVIEHALLAEGSLLISLALVLLCYRIGRWPGRSIWFAFLILVIALLWPVLGLAIIWFVSLSLAILLIRGVRL